MLSEWPFPAMLGYPNLPFGPQHGGGGVSQQEGQLRIFFRIFQNQRVSSLIYNKNSKGPRVDPWGTQQCISSLEESNPFIETYC